MKAEVRLEDAEVRLAIQEYLARYYGFSLKGFSVPKIKFLVVRDVPEQPIEVAAEGRGDIEKRDGIAT